MSIFKRKPKELTPEQKEELLNIYHRLDDVDFNVEEIRKAFQLMVLRAFNECNLKLGDTTPDTFNKTLGINQEYKSNTTGSISSIDSAIRSGKKQADHIVLEILSDISMSDLSNAINDRVKRSANIQTLTILKDNKDHTYTREEMIADGFKIQSSDLN